MRFALVLALLLALLGCNRQPDHPPPFLAPQADAADYASDFQLLDTAGRVRRLADYRGKVVVLFFGYTHCPDVCPTTLGDMAVAMQQLGPLAQQVQVLFVTLDPARDTAAVLNQYVPAFNPAFSGLLASEQQIAQTARAFKVVYRKHITAPGQYSIDHSAGSFVFDKSGHLRLLLPYGQPPADIVHDLKLLLNGS